jgi:uncharacterized protein DUF5658
MSHRVLRTALFIAILANSLDLLVTAFGIHLFGNREGNPLLAGLAHHHWWVFVLVKGAVIPLLIVWLYRARRREPVLASAGLAAILVSLTIAVGRWLGWIAGVVAISGGGRL